MKTWLIIAVSVHTTYAVVKFKSEKYSGLNVIRTHELCETGAVLYQLSYQAIWELVTYMIFHIFFMYSFESLYIHYIFIIYLYINMYN